MSTKAMTIGTLYRRMGPAKFFGMWAAIIGWVVLGIYLVRFSHMPATCPDSGRGIINLVKTLACSPGLLSGGPTEYGLFAWLWSIPAALLTFLLWARAYAKKLSSNRSTNSKGA